MAKKKTTKKGGKKRGAKGLPFDAEAFAGGGSAVDDLELGLATEERYLNYALSVITARAIPDVRDGLKPVQRRILYSMNEDGLRSTARHRKCANVVGQVMGRYHPHGDSAIYEALVRLAQPFAMRVPLVDGSGNFGSIDGDAAAAMRYTECRLAAPADEILAEIREDTVAKRPTYDAGTVEPVVLPSRMPNLLVNGSTGIAVGMATNIPPHNPAEVLSALVRMLDQPDISLANVMRSLPGPDFPTGGQILNSAAELRAIYEKGQGPVKVRGTWEPIGKHRSVQTIAITSIPYAVNKTTLVERIAEIIESRKLPQLLDVRDVSADDIRVELDLKDDAEPEKVMAWIAKQTPFQTNFGVNLTCLVPTERPDVGRPERLGLLEVLRYFLDFRLEVETRKLEHELRLLEERIHVLEGLATVFDALDEIIAIIRASDGKADAAQQIMARFDLDEIQTDAILELKLYRLAKLQILMIREELAEKQARADAVRRLLADEAARWSLVRACLVGLRDAWKKDPDGKRRSVIAEMIDEPEVKAEDFLASEDAVVIVSRDGWIKRQREVKDLAKTKLRRGDEVLAALPGSLRAGVVFFTNFGVAYTSLFADVPATTGHGDPIQKRFKLKDGERIIAAYSLDERVVGKIAAEGDGEPPVQAFALTSDGYGCRFSLAGFAETSNRTGRRFARLAAGAEVVTVGILRGGETLILVTESARALLCPAEELNFLAGPGRGVVAIKIADGDRVLGGKASRGDRDLLTVLTARGAKKTVSTAKYAPTGRGGRGREILKQGRLGSIEIDPPVAPEPLE